jgi:DNA repair protein RadC
MTIKDDDLIVQQAMRILKRRVKQQGELINSPDLMLDMLKLGIGSLEHEVFGLIVADTHMRYLDNEVLFRGTLFHTQVSPREVVKYCLAKNAAGVVFYHNHPAGGTDPSAADINLTRILTNILHVIDVRVVDHIILAGDKHFSFAENGIMPKGETPK